MRSPGNGMKNISVGLVMSKERKGVTHSCRRKKAALCSHKFRFVELLFFHMRLREQGISRMFPDLMGYDDLRRTYPERIVILRTLSGQEDCLGIISTGVWWQKNPFCWTPCDIPMLFETADKDRVKNQYNLVWTNFNLPIWCNLIISPIIGTCSRILKYTDSCTRFWHSYYLSQRLCFMNEYQKNLLKKSCDQLQPQFTSRPDHMFRLWREIIRGRNDWVKKNIGDDNPLIPYE